MNTTDKITIGRCKDCKWLGTGTYGDPSCTNRKKIHEHNDYGRRDNTDDHMVYSYNEGGTFGVGPNFGCVHWVERA